MTHKPYIQEVINYMKNFIRLDRTLQELDQISQDTNITICIVVLDHDYENYDIISEDLKSLVEKNNLCYLNTLPSFKDSNLKDMNVSLLDPHPNAKAQRIFADTIYNDLKKQSLLEKQ